MKNVQPRPDHDTSAVSPVQAAHERTRQRVARLILEHGPQTAAVLADRLAVTPAAIRRHLDAMVADGVVEAREERVYGTRGRGRPAKVFGLTDAGREHFYQTYDDVAVRAMSYIRDTMGEAAVAEFARTLVGRLEESYRSTGHEGTTALAEALNIDGYAASVEPAFLGEQLCQHHCPMAHVAEQFPQLCEAETEVFSRLLGRHVQRLATIAHGDGVCTTHVPNPDAAKPGATGIGPERPDTTHPSTTNPTRAHRTGRTSR